MLSSSSFLLVRIFYFPCYFLVSCFHFYFHLHLLAIFELILLFIDHCYFPCNDSRGNDIRTSIVYIIWDNRILAGKHASSFCRRCRWSVYIGFLDFKDFQLSYSLVAFLFFLLVFIADSTHFPYLYFQEFHGWSKERRKVQPKNSNLEI